MTKRINVVLTNEMHEKITELSRETGQPLATIVRDALAVHLKRKGLDVTEVHPGWGGHRGDDEDDK